MKFQIGSTYMTAGIKAKVAEDKVFAQEVYMCLHRHSQCDWGDLSEDDKQSNDEALQTGDRILSAYETTQGRIWIITEADRSATTVLFPDEY